MDLHIAAKCILEDGCGCTKISWRVQLDAAEKVGRNGKPIRLNIQHGATALSNARRCCVHEWHKLGLKWMGRAARAEMVVKINATPARRKTFSVKKLIGGTL